MTLHRIACVVAALWVAGPALAVAQNRATTDSPQNRATADSPQITRAELETRWARLRDRALNPNLSGAARKHAEAEAALIHARLKGGDFKAGDRVWVEVVGEPELTDTFTVAAGPVLILPDIGDVPLAGVLRSELQPHLEQHASRFFRDPTVRARTLVRVAVLGEVLEPGFYVTTPETPITNVLMLAGGPTREAALSAIRVEREGRNVLKSEALLQAMSEGRTLEEMRLGEGDRFFVPRLGEKFSVIEMLRALAVVAPLIVLGAREL